MTRETAQKHKKEILAFIDGSEIEYLDWQGVWRLSSCPSWDDDTEYRIKPREPREFWVFPRNTYGCEQMNGDGKPIPGQIRVREILTDETP